jgi:hypothetical protein
VSDYGEDNQKFKDEWTKRRGALSAFDPVYFVNRKTLQATYGPQAPLKPEENTVSLAAALSRLRAHEGDYVAAEVNPDALRHALDARAKEADKAYQRDLNRRLYADGTDAIRSFSTGATRDSDEGKNDYEGFLNPLVLEAYGDYMRAHQVQSDGTLRASDNWQKGIPKVAYAKSLIRHVWTVWKLHRGLKVKAEKVGGEMVVPTMKEALCALLFNVMGYLLEELKEEGKSA